MKIALIAASFTGNQGAATMLESAISNIRAHKPGAEIYVFSPFPKADRLLAAQRGLSAFSSAPLDLVARMIPQAAIYWLGRRMNSNWVFGRDIKAMSQMDFVIDLAGISFSDGRELFLAYNVLSLVPPLLLGKRVIKAPQALGSYNNRLNRCLARLILKKMHAIIARGKTSYQSTAGLGLGNVALGADLGFSLPKTPPASRADLQDSASGNKLVGISVSAVLKERCDRSGKNYLAIIEEFLKSIMDRYDVVVVPHSAGSAGSERQSRLYRLLSLVNKPRSDLGISRELVARLDSPRVRLADAGQDATALRSIIGACDLFIASRFHAMISALTEEVPVMVCGWGHKYEEVLSDFGLNEFHVAQECLEAGRLTEVFERLEEQAPEIKKRIALELPALTARSRRFLDYLNET